MAKINLFNLCSILDEDKLNMDNFLDWEKRLRIVLKSTNKESVLDTPIPRITANSKVEEQKQAKSIRMKSVSVTCLMLATMEPNLQKRFRKMDAHTIIRRLRDMSRNKSRLRKYGTSKAIRRGIGISESKKELQLIQKNKRKKEGTHDFDQGIYVIEVNLANTFDSQSWVFDTGCGAHIIYDVQGLKGIKYLSGRELVLRVANRATVAAKAIGT